MTYPGRTDNDKPFDTAHLVYYILGCRTTLWTKKCRAVNLG